MAYNPEHWKIKESLADIARAVEREMTDTYEIVDSGVIFNVPVNVGRALVSSKYIYLCSGCPNWHIQSRNLPEGVTGAGFRSLLRKLFSWRRDERWEKARLSLDKKFKEREKEKNDASQDV